MKAIEKTKTIWKGTQEIAVFLGIGFFPLLTLLYLLRDTGFKGLILLIVIIPYYYGLRYIRWRV